MPQSDFIPDREADLITWANNFSTLLTAAPTSYGVTALQATALATDLAAFETARQIANDPLTNSEANTFAKNTAKRTLINNIRLLVREIQGTPTVTDQQRINLGITVRDVEPTPVPVPDSQPVLTILSVAGRVAEVRIRDSAHLTRRGKPEGVAGATILLHVGEAPPVDVLAWSFLMNATRTDLDVDFPSNIATGAKVWLTCFWFNARGESGPAATPQHTIVLDGPMMMAA